MGGTACIVMTMQFALVHVMATASAVLRLLEKLSARVDERLTQDRQRVNLKRPRT